MHILMIAIVVRVGMVATAPAHCGAPRDIGGGQTVRTCEIARGK